MTEPQRILDLADEDMESMLLQSAKRDAPSERAVNEALVALGLGGGVAVGVTTAVTTGGAAAGASIPPTAAVAGKVGFAVLVKWVGLAAIGGLAAWGIVGQATEQAPQNAAPALAQVAAEADQGTLPSSPGAAQATPPAGSAADDDGAEETAAAADVDEAEPSGPTEPSPRPHAPLLASAEPQPTKAAQPTLGDEVAALDRARKTMDDDPDAALKAIEDYQKKFGDGMLAQEAKVLRIESLERVGKHEQARAAAGTFLAQHPSSPLAPRVRKVLSTAKK